MARLKISSSRSPSPRRMASARSVISTANCSSTWLRASRFAIEMTDLADAIRRGDGEQLLEIFSRAKAARDRYVDGMRGGE